MEVTRKNFREVLAELESTIPSAEFLAIDGEFTGLQKIGQDVNAFDTPSQYYTKVRSSCVDFLLIQFGLCIFKYDEKSDKYTHRAYNFYLFPQAHSRSGPDPRFLCQSSSIEFLVSQGFDFNKLFKEGIPYLTQPEEEKMRENLKDKWKSRSITNASSSSNGEEIPLIPIPEQHLTFIEDVCSQIEKFLERSEPEELELDRCNAFLRKLIFQEVGQRFDSNKVYLKSKVVDSKNRVLVVTRTGSEEERKKKEKEKMEKDFQELEDAVGFASVVKKISESGKLVIGHNMLLDICHVVHQCYFPLPEDYSEFKELIECVFPKLLDTKYMSYSSIFKELIHSNVLEHLHKTLSEKPFKSFAAEPEDGLGYSTVSEKYHEAGFDAYITGLCFIAMANHIGSLQKPEIYPVLPSSSLLEPYMNKLFLMRVQDSPYINLVGKDPEPSRNHVFFISFPKEWKSSDITQLFSPFGSVYIAWINETSAFVALYKRDQSSLVKRTLMQNDSCTLMTYASYQKLQDGKTKCCTHSDRTSLCRTNKLSSSSSSSTNIKRQRLEPKPEIPLKRNRNRLLDGSLSIDVIPEEQEILEVDYEVKASNSKGNSGTEADDGASSSKISPSNDSTTTNKKKEFEENNLWG